MWCFSGLQTRSWCAERPASLQGGACDLGAALSHSEGLVHRVYETLSRSREHWLARSKPTQSLLRMLQGEALFPFWRVETSCIWWIRSIFLASKLSLPPPPGSLKIWNHPDVLYEALQKENHANEQDLDLDDITSAGNPRCAGPGPKAKVADTKANNPLPLVNTSQDRANQVITYEWVCRDRPCEVAQFYS